LAAQFNPQVDLKSLEWDQKKKLLRLACKRQSADEDDMVKLQKYSNYTFF
jgi:hypothetical protein